jgi:hypothetical protein
MAFNCAACGKTVNGKREKNDVSLVIYQGDKEYLLCVVCTRKYADLTIAETFKFITYKELVFE